MRKLMFLLWLLAYLACSGHSNEKTDAASSAAGQQPSTAQFENISADSAYAMMQRNVDNPDFVVLDVRTPGEYQRGHLESAIMVDFSASDFSEKMTALDKDKTYLMHCRSGNRSGQALSVMKELGFKKIYHMNRGMIEWNERGLPVVGQ